MLGGSQDNSFSSWKPSGGPNGWYQPGTGDGGACQVDPQSPTTVYASTQMANIWKSIDGGLTYLPAIIGLNDSGDSAGPFYADFDIDHQNPNRLICGSMNIWRTTNGALGWTSVRAQQGVQTCQVVEFAEANTSRVWVGYSGPVGTATSTRISRSDDFGTSWVNVSGGSATCNGSSATLPDTQVRAIATHPTDVDSVWVAFGGYADNRVWFSDDAGATWECRSGPPLASGTGTTLPWGSVNAMIVHPSSPEWLYVGTDVGIFASEDGGRNWSRMPRFSSFGTEGPANVRVDDLFWMGQYLVAATHGRGMFRALPRPVIWVDLTNNSGIEDGTYAFPYNTVQEAESAAGHGTAIVIRSGTYNEGDLVLFKKGLITVEGGTVVIR